MTRTSRAGLVLAGLLAAPAAWAQQGPPDFMVGEAHGFGAGLVVGSPSGVGLAWRPRDANMVQAAVGWSLDDDWLSANVDYLFDLTVIEQDSTPNIVWPVYLGAGGRLRIGDGKGQRSGIGARVPIGMRMEPTDLKLDVFIELAPFIMLLPETYAGVDFNLGVRMYFGR